MQKTKKQLCFCELAMNNAKVKLRKQLHLKQHQKEKILKFICNFKGHWIAKTVLKKKNKVGGLRFLDFKIYYKDKINQNSVGIA